jgi:hypothetical protein
MFGDLMALEQRHQALRERIISAGL